MTLTLSYKNVFLAALFCAALAALAAPPFLSADAAFDKALKEAENGGADAQFKLAEMYYFGDGAPKSFPEALKWYTLAAEQGIADAQFRVGVMYDTGEGVTQDRVEAFKWFLLAAEQAKPRRSLMLGICTTMGMVCQKTKPKL